MTGHSENCIMVVVGTSRCSCPPTLPFATSLCTGTLSQKLEYLCDTRPLSASWCRHSIEQSGGEIRCSA